MRCWWPWWMETRHPSQPRCKWVWQRSQRKTNFGTAATSLLNTASQSQRTPARHLGPPLGVAVILDGTLPCQGQNHGPGYGAAGHQAGLLRGFSRGIGARKGMGGASFGIIQPSTFTNRSGYFWKEWAG